MFVYEYKYQAKVSRGKEVFNYVPVVSKKGIVLIIRTRKETKMSSMKKSPKFNHSGRIANGATKMYIKCA